MSRIADRRLPRLAAAAALLAATALGLERAPAVAQENLRREIRESQLRLDQIRQERERLQREMDQLGLRARDADRELQNLARQRSASESALRELDFQADMLATSVAETELQRTLTHSRLAERGAALRQRLRAIYKRGALHEVRVLLGSENFSDLLSRYKYLHMMATYERMLIDDISRLENQLAQQEDELRENLTQLELLRGEKFAEVQRLETLGGQRQRSMREIQQQQRATESRLTQLARDEAAVSTAIADLERLRLEEERAGSSANATLTTRDLGSLNWPVDGNLVFRFGPERRPNGVILRYNGIGIAAPAGSGVKAVEAGTVQIAGPLEGYGNAVVVSHGAGSYTLYLRLRSVVVRTGQAVTAGTVVGTVGGDGTPQGPHLEFQVRVPGPSGTPTPVDPLNWLRAR